MPATLGRHLQRACQLLLSDLCAMQDNRPSPHNLQVAQDRLAQRREHSGLWAQVPDRLLERMIRAQTVQLIAASVFTSVLLAGALSYLFEFLVWGEARHEVTALVCAVALFVSGFVASLIIIFIQKMRRDERSAKEAGGCSKGQCASHAPLDLCL